MSKFIKKECTYISMRCKYLVSAQNANHYVCTQENFENLQKLVKALFTTKFGSFSSSWASCEVSKNLNKTYLSMEYGDCCGNARKRDVEIEVVSEKLFSILESL